MSYVAHAFKRQFGAVCCIHLPALLGIFEKTSNKKET